MKITLRVLIIFAITALVAGGIYLLVETTSIAGSLSSGMDSGRPSGGEMRRGERPEGDHNHNQSASLLSGLAAMGGSLVKISIITMIVFVIQFIFTRFPKWKTARNLAT